MIYIIHTLNHIMHAHYILYTSQCNYRVKIRYDLKQSALGCLSLL